MKLSIENVSPEFKAKVEERAKKFGFSTVQDYLIHLILVESKMNEGKGKSKLRKVRDIKKLKKTSNKSKADIITTVTWEQVTGYLRGNYKDFTTVTFLAPNITTTLDSTVSTGGEKTNGVPIDKIEKYLKSISSTLEGSHVAITVCHNNQNIGFLKGREDSVFGVKSATLEGDDIINEWFEEDTY